MEYPVDRAVETRPSRTSSSGRLTAPVPMDPQNAVLDVITLTIQRMSPSSYNPHRCIGGAPYGPSLLARNGVRGRNVMVKERMTECQKTQLRLANELQGA